MPPQIPAGGAIHLLGADRQLVRLEERAYDSEDLLQSFLAEHPDLLAGEQIDGVNPRRWLLVEREAALPSEEGGGGRWSVDHLFLDQDAIPTIIEVKRSTDTRIRREVVGQMLDYAANAVVYWPVEALRARFEATCANEGRDAVVALQRVLSDANDQEDFWARVKTNLQAGKVRLVFVADDIPPELRRVVEFLNGQMDPAEVLAVEIKQYVGQGLAALVPRVIGQTVAAKDAKSTASASSARGQWDEMSFLDALTARSGSEAATVASRLLAWTYERRLRPQWGNGHQDGSFYAMLDHAGQSHCFFGAWTSGTASVQFGDMLRLGPPFADEGRRRELLDRLNMIPGVTLDPKRIAKYPSLPLVVLRDEQALLAFFQAFEWAISMIQGSITLTEPVIP